MNDDLQPCPFCGEPACEQAHEHTHIYMGFMPEHGGSYTVECTACSAGVISLTRDNARELWNRRTAPDKEALAAHVEPNTCPDGGTCSHSQRGSTCGDPLCEPQGGES